MCAGINFTTADLVDDFEGELQSCETQFRNMGGNNRFFGPITTIKCQNDNALLKTTLATPSKGGVLVIDGGANMRSALVGDIIASLAIENGWAGLIVNGPIRDSVMIASMAIGLKALGTNPAKSTKMGAGDKDIPVNFGGVSFEPGDWAYSDEDGIVIAKRELPLI